MVWQTEALEEVWEQLTRDVAADHSHPFPLSIHLYPQNPITANTHNSMPEHFFLAHKGMELLYTKQVRSIRESVFQNQPSTSDEQGAGTEIP